MNFKAIFSQLHNIVRKLNKKQKITIIVTVIVVVAFLSYLLVASVGGKRETFSGYGVLFEGMSTSDNALALQYLQQNNVPYKISEGTILVPNNRVYEERLSLASQGIPKESRVGFEIFNDSSFGETEGQQKIKFIRALEGELSRTIESLNPIKKASVKVTFPEDTVFTSKATLPTASVSLTMNDNMVLNSKQILGIKNLVAASVSKLAPENVSLIDQNGYPLGVDDPATADKNKADMEKKYRSDFEKDRESKIVVMLSQLVGGANRVVAQVSADFDFSQKESTEEIFGKDPAVLSTQSLEEERRGLSPKEPGGVPGAVSNIGPVQGLDEGLKEEYKKSTNTTNFTPDKVVNKIKNEYPMLKRLTASVIVDGRYEEKEDSGGEKIYTFIPRSSEELDQIKNLIRNAIGFNEERGDQVVVSSFELTNLRLLTPPLTSFEKVTRAFEKYLGPFMPLLRYVLVIIVLFFFYKKVIAPFAERMLEVHEEEDSEDKSLFDFEEDEDMLNRANEMRKKVEEQLGIGEGFNEDAVKYDVLLEKLKDSLRNKSDEIASLFQALIRDEIEVK